MKSKLRDELFARCSELILENIPQFAPYSEKTIYLWPGEVVFRSVDLIAPKMAFIVLSPHAKYDQVTVEVGWSETGLFPQLPQRPSSGLAQNALRKSEATVRVPSLNTNQGMKDDWLTISFDNIDVVANRIVKLLREDALPYLHRVGQ